MYIDHGWRILDIVIRRCDAVQVLSLVGDLVHSGEKRELVLQTLHLQHMVNLLGRQCALQLLPGKQFCLDLFQSLGPAPPQRRHQRTADCGPQSTL